MSTLESASVLISRGFSVIPIPPREKGPRLPEWQNLRLTRDDLQAYFAADSNVGILLGEPSRGMVDIDLDHPLAVKYAPEFLPHTGAVFGRYQKPRSHYIYTVPGATTRKWQLPQHGMIVELRSTGCQTVAPGSIHPSGDEIVWYSQQPPAEVSEAELVAQISALVDKIREELGVPHEPPRPTRTVTIITSGTAYALAALKGECEAVRDAPNGAGNETVYKAGLKLGGLVAAGALDENEVYRCVTEAFDTWTFEQPSDRVRMVKSLKSGVEDGKKRPREVPVTRDRPPRPRPGADGEADRGVGKTPQPHRDGRGETHGQGDYRRLHGTSAGGVRQDDGEIVQPEHGGLPPHLPPPRPDLGVHNHPDPGSFPDPAPSFRAEENFDLPILHLDGGATEQHTTFALAHVGNHPDIYTRSGRLVRLIVAKDTQPVLSQCNVHHVRDILSSTIRVYKPHPKNPQVWLYRPPPDPLCNSVLTAGNFPSVRHVRGVLPFPILRPDGSIVTTPGYDHASGFIYHGTSDIPSLSSDPAACAELIISKTADFPFKTDADRSAWLAAVLTPLARPVYEGPTPLFLCVANVAGAGKGKLMNLASIIVTGRRAPPAQPWTDESEEQRKLLTSIFSEARPVIILDNLTRLSSRALDMALTTTEWTDRLLGTNTAVSLPIITTFWATGNNVALHGDMARRTVPITLQSDLPDPHIRTNFKTPDIEAHVLANRPALVSAALSLLSASLRATPGPAIPLGSFESWSRVVQQAVLLAGLPDPLTAQHEATTDADDTRSQLVALLTAWHDAYGESPKTIHTIIEDCGRRPSSDLLESAVDFSDLNFAIRDFCNASDRETINSTVLGSRLGRVKMKVAQLPSGTCVRLTQPGRDNKGKVVWKLQVT